MGFAGHLQESLAADKAVKGSHRKARPTSTLEACFVVRYDVLSRLSWLSSCS